ncbi:exonuclease 1 isoform X2 [Hemicordylus capensis]|nr:exonuclease 1 isoform X2 [Hemicordylus capensis]
MACEVIKAARAQGIDCIVAPYEADAQLAYLNKIGIVQAIITEDSDLLAFGCKKVFLKIDKFGNGLEIDQARLGMCKQLGDVFTEEKFRYMCILSGCDYLPSIHGIGLAKACKLLKIANNPDIIKVIGKIGQYLKMNISVPEEYIQGFIRANNTFLYQLVFDPVRRKLVPLNAYDEVDPETLLYAGRHMGDSNAFQIALGNKDLNTMEQIDDYNPDAPQCVQPRSRSWNDKCGSEKPSNLKSIWSRDYNPGFTSKITTSSEPPIEKPTTRGIERLINTRGLKFPGKALLAKRPRQEEVSEGDLLSQYSFPNAKTPRTEKGADGEQHAVISAVSVIHSSKDLSSHKESSNSEPRLRNRFAFLLHKKNQERGAVVVPGTRSRFFCGIMDAPDDILKEEIHEPAQDREKDCHIVEAESGITEDHSPCSPENGEMGRTISPSPAAPQTSCFSWSRNFAERSATPSPSQSVAALKLMRFHRQTPNKDTSQGCKMSELQMLSSKTSTESDEGSSPLKELGCSSEQKSDKLLQSSLETPDNSPVTNEKVIGARESDSSPEPDCNQNSQISPFFDPLCIKDKVPKSMVPGLQKAISVKGHVVTKCKLLMPAKVSGLSKKTSTKKKNHHNAENKSEVQVTINDLWKSFQFKRESEKLPSSRKPEPLSPVKDNIQLTPDTDDDSFNKLEFSHVQRKIFQ